MTSDEMFPRIFSDAEDDMPMDDDALDEGEEDDEDEDENEDEDKDDNDEATTEDDFGVEEEE